MSEYDEGHDPPEPDTDTPGPVEDDVPRAGVEVSPDVPELAEVPPAYEPPPAPKPAEPGIYWCADEDPGISTPLGQLTHGENDFTGLTHPDALMALAALVEAGVLTKGEDRPAKDEPSHEASDR